MLIHLNQTDAWDQINNSIKKSLGITDPKINIHTFHNIGQAVFDFLLGLRQFLPHKKTIILIEGGDPNLQSLTLPLFREAYQVITLKPHFINSNANWLSEITATDILCVLTSRDHAFTGELWLNDSNIKLLAAKKIPVIEISHSLHFNNNFQDDIAARPFLLQVQDYDDLAIGITGARTKIYPQSTTVCQWNFAETLSKFEQAKKRHTRILPNQKTILEFEAGISAPATPYFAINQQNRIFDRAIVCLNKVTGDQFLHNLKSNLKQSEFNIDCDKYCDVNYDFATPHLCQWGGFGHFSWWGHEGISPEKQMTIIAISLNFIEQKNSLKIFNETLSSCLKENKLV